MASDIRVVKEQLGAFAGKVETENTAMNEAFPGYVDQFMSGSMAISGSQTSSARSLAADYGSILDALGQYMVDQSMGLMFLQQGAVTVQANYTAADDESGNGMKTVDAAFNPPEGESVRQMLEDVDNGGGTEGVEVPPGAEDGLPEPTDMSPEDYGQPAASEAAAGTQDENGQAIMHESEQANILSGATSEPGEPLDTTGLDSDLEEDYQQQLQTERLNGAGAAGVL